MTEIHAKPQPTSPSPAKKAKLRKEKKKTLKRL
jgi:hypothetical protein